MNCKCKVDQRRLTPGVFNLKQFLNGSETMVWELDTCLINEGTCDLKEYDAFLTLCVAGEIDEILLTKRQTGDTLQLVWNVGEYATALTGYVKYQISFRSAEFDTLGVIADDPEAAGLYALTDKDATGNDRIYQKAENGYSFRWDAENGRWALYQADGTTVVDFQTTANTEPYCGAWGNIGVGNNEAAAWISDEAIMYVSDSIAADQKITANFPTILRQLWKKINKSGVTSVNGKTGIVELAPADIGALPAEEAHEHEIEDIKNLTKKLAEKAPQTHEKAKATNEALGHIKVDNKTIKVDENGVIWVAEVPKSEIQEFTNIVEKKAESNFSNITNVAQSFKTMSIGWGMPDYTAGVDISSRFATAGSSYTVPYDCCMFACGAGGEYYVHLYRKSGCNLTNTEHWQYVLLWADEHTGSDAFSCSHVYLPKGMVIYNDSTLKVTGNVMIYPLKGADK